MYAKRGAECSELAKYHSAIEDFKKAFQLDPVNAGFDGPYGDSFSWMEGEFFIDKTSASTKEFSKALAVFPKDLPLLKSAMPTVTLIDTACPVIKPRFSKASDFHEGLALITESNFQDTGYIDKSGEVTISEHNSKSHLSFVDHFSEGLAPIFIGYKHGFINHQAEIVIPPFFDAVRPFCDGLALVEMAGRYGYIDKTGKLTIEPQFDLPETFRMD